MSWIIEQTSHCSYIVRAKSKRKELYINPLDIVIFLGLPYTHEGEVVTSEGNVKFGDYDFSDFDVKEYLKRRSQEFR